MQEINDDYEHEESVEYILENVLMPDDGSVEFKHLRDNYNSQLTLKCTCGENNNICSSNVHCCHGGCFVYNHEQDELVLAENASIIECNDLCNCQLGNCRNRLVQYGPRKNLDIFYSPLFKSRGLRTTVNIPSGAFICEYAGELLTLTEAKRRLHLTDKHERMNYVLCLHEYARDVKDETAYRQAQLTIVDPSRRGNIGRYLNHSCEPNCEIYAVRTNSPIPKLGIFAKRKIHAFEELCFHYGGEDFQAGLLAGKACLCAAPNCTGFLPNTKI